MSSIDAELGRIIGAAKAHRDTRAAFVGQLDRDYALNVLQRIAMQNDVKLYLASPAGRLLFHPERLAYEPCGGPCADPSELLRSGADIRGSALIAYEELLPRLRAESGDAAARVQLSNLLSTSAHSDGHLLVFLEPPESERYIPVAVGGHVARLQLPLPTAVELHKVVQEELLAAYCLSQRQPPEPQALLPWYPQFAQGLTGLTHTGARLALRDVLTERLSNLAAAQALLEERKGRTLSQRLAMQLLSTNGVQPPIGLDHVYEYLRINRHRIGVPGCDRVKGILLVGPPGTGKTQLARAAARLVLMRQVVEFRVSSLMNSLLGATERLFEEAIAVLEAMAPTLIFMDELEKIFGDHGHESDGGTMMRVTGRLLSWLSDSQAANFIIATGNNVTRMGEVGLTMTRKGRFDRLFFVDVPNQRARCLILERLLSGVVSDPKNDADALAKVTDHFSGADLEACVNDARARAKFQKVDLCHEHIVREIELNRKRVDALYATFNPLRRWAELNCEPAGPAD